MVELTAKISGLVYSNRQTGFHVLRTSPTDGTPGQVTVRGTFPNIMINLGLKAKFSGNFEVHERWGRQLVATSCEIIPDEGRNGIVVYLTSNVPSIGPITAGRMYDALGDDLIRLLDEDPQRVAELPFLTRPQAAAILKEWSEASETRVASIFLADLGLGPTLIKEVFTHFGIKATRSVVKDNPYNLTQVSGVGFVTADQAARKLGIGVDDVRRVRAMILFVMSEMATTEGHMFCTSEQIQAYVEKRLFSKHTVEPFTHGRYLVDRHLYHAIVALQKSGEIHADGERLYLRRHWGDEYGIAQCLAPIIVQGPILYQDLDSVLTQFEKKNGLELSPEQRAAFLALSKSRVITISGYPGTGKTLLISAFVYLFEHAQFQYTLLSPTGIAAKRLSQVTCRSASTIHRALGYKRDGSWEFNRHNKYVTDAVIIDEMSMVDSSTFHHLVSALTPQTMIIMVGDSAQLPSVGAGNVLHHLMHCDAVPHVMLTRIFRQEQASDIVKTAHAILRGENIDLSFRPKSEFVFMNFPQDEVVSRICGLTEALKERGRIFQVVAPVYDGELGVNKLNGQLRDVLNPQSLDDQTPNVRQWGRRRSSVKDQSVGETKDDAMALYVGDRVMVVRNDYDRMIYNGDVGKVTRISMRDDQIMVKIFDWFDQETQTYTKKEFTFKIEEARQILRVAFACTAHKVQGQEFDYVILPMTRQYGIMLYRNLVYTAITRARRKVYVFGDPHAFLTAVANEREAVRNSNLGLLIVDRVNYEIVRNVMES
jgi:exodeoxyribonuclease V alpha subunit